MKKIIIALIFSIVYLNSYSQTIDAPTIVGIGYSRSSVHGANTRDTFNTFEFTGFGLYISYGDNNDYNIGNVYGFGVYNSKTMMRFGISTPRLYFNEGKFTQMSFGVTAYYGFVNSNMRDSSGNYIGWKDYPSLVELKNSTDYYYSFFGVKIDYTFSYLNVGIILSPNEISFSIGIAFERLLFN